MRISLPLPVLGALVVFTSSCAPSYMIHPDRETDYEIDGQEAQMAEAEGCRVIAYSVENDYQDLIAHVRVLNSSGAEMKISPTDFSLSGPALRGDTVKAVEPSAYFKKLNADAENLRNRTQLSTWDGVEALTKNLPAAEGKTDKDIEKLRKEYEASERRKKKDLKRSAELIEKGKALRTRLFETTQVRSGQELKGEILIPGPFEKTGKVTLSLNHDQCTASLPFTLKK